MARGNVAFAALEKACIGDIGRCKMKDERQKFLSTLYADLKAHPDWIPETLRMLALSAEDAERNYAGRTADAQRACSYALALVTERRVDKKLKALLGGEIVKHLRGIKNRCGIEDDAIEILEGGER